ncbi:hypothetical protein [Curtobacterium flaccumfaciens]|uniref:hypothetical protein n=1 Tax=Curtobacterium flaccumfaciens TaxID=2035 RepID=UPI0015FFFAE4|nr:hypothetical protein [Curtobacterium flaccumfaciens]MBB1196976.1 hypothetical protein [Curtobacterium flaccumfaciens]
MDTRGSGRRSARITSALVSVGGLVVAMVTGAGLWLGHEQASTSTSSDTSTSSSADTSTDSSTQPTDAATDSTSGSGTSESGTTDSGTSDSDTGVSQGATGGTSDTTTTGS